MNKDEIIGVFENIARLLELKGENPFKIRAYLHASKALETLAEPLEKLIAEERLVAVDGIGKATAEKIATLSTTGRLDYYNDLRDEFPPDILTLFDIQGLGGKKIKALWDSLKIHSVTSLERACKDGRVATLPGFGEKTATNIFKAIEHMRSHAGEFRFGDIAALAGSLLEDLRTHPEVGQAQIAGSFRRKKEIVRDLDFLVSTKKPEAVMEFFTTHPLVENILAHGATKSSVILKNGIQCDLRAVTAAEFPFALNYFTGSKEHNVRMRSRALSRGWSLNEYRFSAAEGRERLMAVDDSASGESTRVVVEVPNRPGVLSEIATALGHAHINIEDLDLVPAVAGEPAGDRKSTRLNSSHSGESRMPSSA